jgi:hypothetical protein
MGRLSWPVLISRHRVSNFVQTAALNGRRFSVLLAAFGGRLV